MQIIFLFVFCLCFVSDALVVSDYFKICNRDDPGLNRCLKNSIQDALPRITKGIKEINFSPLDPHLVKELIIQYSQNQISGKAYLKDIRASGLSKAKVHDVRANIQDDSFDLEVDMSQKKVFIEGYTKGEGRLNALVFETTTYDYFNNSMSDLTWTWKLTGTPFVKDEKTYLKITKFFMRPEVGDMTVYVPPIFGDNHKLNKIALDFSNTYWRVIYRELLPLVELSWNKIGIKAANKIFQKIPYNELFPDV